MNPLLRKTLAVLVHPLTLLALVVLLLNDHFFRILHPSWFTGKLGDAAWLFFAPPALLALLAAAGGALPARWQAQRWLPALAFGLVGGVYTFGNLSAAFAAWLEAVGGKDFGFPLLIRCDPGDLLALPFLAGSYLLWRRTPAQTQRGSFAAGAAAALLAAVLTLANSAAPQYGVNGLAVDGVRVVACTAYTQYVSLDGGLTWQVDDVGFADACRGEWNGLLEVPWQGQDMRLRYNEESHTFERESGAGWTAEYTLQPASQAGQALLARENQSNLHLSDGPYTAVFDPTSGNVVVALGLDGALVRTPDGEWQPVAVGEFRRRQVNSLRSFTTLLNGELVMALGVTLLLLGTAGARLKPRWYTILPLVLGALGWALTALFQPALYNNYPIPLGFLFIAAAVFLVPVGVSGLVSLIERGGRSLLFGALFALDGFILFLLPFVLWALDLIPTYSTAQLLACGLALAELAALLVILRREPEAHLPG